MKTVNVIELEHRYAHPPAAVWKALTTPELHALWWAAGDVRPIVGHKFELDMGRWDKQPCDVLAVEPEGLLR
ncbi:MAG: SRPBCC domain-containing protein [Hyphomicrobium sp.]|nr:SRPBCC domain-containing protein [Hyphomicrobium sp.]